MRGKEEEAHDYRIFLIRPGSNPALKNRGSKRSGKLFLNSLMSKKERFVRDYGIPEYDAGDSDLQRKPWPVITKNLFISS